MHYADTSFLVSLLTPDPLTPAATSAYRSLRRPRLVFGPLHEIEVRNTLRCHQFTEALHLPSKQRHLAESNRVKSESRLSAALRSGAFTPRDGDWSAVIEDALLLSEKHTPSRGTRTLDILHVAFALQLGCKDFITCDTKQATLAKASGLRVTHVQMI